MGRKRSRLPGQASRGQIARPRVPHRNAPGTHSQCMGRHRRRAPGRPELACGVPGVSACGRAPGRPELACGVPGVPGVPRRAPGHRQMSLAGLFLAGRRPASSFAAFQATPAQPRPLIQRHCSLGTAMCHCCSNLSASLSPLVPARRKAQRTARLVGSPAVRQRQL
jgi:hypothetical protein